MITHQILIVDDEPEHLNSILDIIEESKEPYTFLKTLSGPKAIEIARKENPDLIITDWAMPDMGGIELIQRLKRDEATKDIPILMCTGIMTSSDNLESALNAGAIDFVRKPIDKIELVARLRSTLKLADSFKTIKRQNQIILVKAEELDYLARHDTLTRLSNRRDFLEKAQREIDRIERSHKPFSLIMADIDHFKLFNDKHGHDCGDLVLTELADFLRDKVRKQDCVVRWGGEEFILFLPETSVEGAQIKAERIREDLESQKILFKGCELSVSLTLGVSRYEIGEDIDRVISRADDALYRGKAQGRNRVVVSPGQSGDHE